LKEPVENTAAYALWSLAVRNLSAAITDSLTGVARLSLAGLYLQMDLCRDAILKSRQVMKLAGDLTKQEERRL
jgi:hypothetical protein